MDGEYASNYLCNRVSLGLLLPELSVSSKSLLCQYTQLTHPPSAGIGGGGIVGSVWVITAELVEVQHRAKWSQALSLTWSCSAIAGPLLGGVFSK